MIRKKQIAKKKDSRDQALTLESTPKPSFHDRCMLIVYFQVTARLSRAPYAGPGAHQRASASA